MDSIFAMPHPWPADHGDEVFEPILSGTGGLLVERIISDGHCTPENQWYDQELDEWVTLLEGSATILYQDGEERHLSRGNTLFIPRRVRHRVTRTSSPCIWLAIHGTLHPEIK